MKGFEALWVRRSNLGTFGIMAVDFLNRSPRGSAARHETERIVSLHLISPDTQRRLEDRSSRSEAGEQRHPASQGPSAPRGQHSGLTVRGIEEAVHGRLRLSSPCKVRG
jgi:hypothetical protein